MKIINSHIHLVEIEKMMQEKEKYLGFLESIASFKNIQETLPLLTVETVLKQMEEAGITQSVLFACDAPLLYASNEFVANICKLHPQKFIGFASVNPKKDDAVKILENAITQLGLRGLKLHPPLQDFYPNDQVAWPVYQMASTLKIPVVFHVGSTPFGSMVKLSQANPILIDDVATAFPSLKIILTHLGTMWHNETFMLVEKNPNVYVDTAAYPYEIKALLTKELIERIGENKIIFGTDFPMPYEGKTHNMKDNVDAINAINVCDEIKKKIFCDNFERILRI
jgi:predicted TIM-barrel fold metal-dependent hydrolase